jgi:hypothetical protein
MLALAVVLFVFAGVVCLVGTLALFVQPRTRMNMGAAVGTLVVGVLLLLAGLALVGVIP